MPNILTHLQILHVPCPDANREGHGEIDLLEEVSGTHAFLLEGEKESTIF